MATAFQLRKFTSTLTRHQHRCNWQRSYPTASLIKESPKFLNIAETWKWKAIKPMCSLCCRWPPKNETQKHKSSKKINVLNALLDSQMLVNEPVLEECVEVIDRKPLKNKTEPSHCLKPVDNVYLPATNRRMRITTSKSCPSMYVTTIRIRRCYKQNPSVTSQIIPERDPIEASDPCKGPKNDPCKDPKNDPCKPKDDPCKKREKENPCKPKPVPKPDPCKPKPNPCPPKKEDPCADPCAPRKGPNPCKKPC